MRAYSATSEEALQARDLLKDWAGEGFLTEEQHRRMEQETPCDLRRTNLFLRAGLCLFTLIIVSAVLGLFVLGTPGRAAVSTLFILFAAATYATAEEAVSRYQLYRHGIEEALLGCSIGFFCGGLFQIFGNAGSWVPAVGVVLCVWIWYRFGLPYAPLPAMFFVFWLTGEWNASHPMQRTLTAAIFAIAVAAVAVLRRPHRLTYLNGRYSTAEAVLWLGIYLVINLELIPPAAREFAKDPFYWTAWALTWILPPLMLARGVHRKDRLVLIAGAITAILTFATNKSYLGWTRHTWDPMLLGALLIAVALYLRRWLAAGPDGVRRGFTARSLSGKDKTYIDTGTTAIAFTAPLAPTPQPHGPQDPFGGGESGGGGASSDF